VLTIRTFAPTISSCVSLFTTLPIICACTALTTRKIRQKKTVTRGVKWGNIADQYNSSYPALKRGFVLEFQTDIYKTREQIVFDILTSLLSLALVGETPLWLTDNTR
jgi:hypothetical protein